MPVTVGSDMITNYLYHGASLGSVPFTSIFSIYARRGTRTGGGSSAQFRLDQPGPYGGYDNASKVMSGYGSFTGPSQRFNYPYAMAFRTWGLSINFLDDLSVNWDYNTGYHGGEVTMVMAAASYDQTGFQIYSNFSYLSGVSPLNGTFNFSYIAWGN
jgi:hypothetical protein